MSTLVHYFLPHDIDGSKQLLALALDLQWSWSHSADELWKQIDPELWSLTRNPWVVIQTVSRTKLKALSEDADFRRRLEALAHRQQQHAHASAWCHNNHAHQPLSNVAYFSMEFMLSEALPIYSGGLGMSLAISSKPHFRGTHVPRIVHREFHTILLRLDDCSQRR